MPLVRVAGLTRLFGGFAALSELSLEFHGGRVHGIIGPNGSGKTTLVNCITGFLNPTYGDVLLDGLPIGGFSPSRLARLGVLRGFQGAPLVPNLTVLENVMCGNLQLSPRRVVGAVTGLPVGGNAKEEALRDRAVGLLRRLGLHMLRDRMAFELVWSECQMVQFARLLLQDSRLLFLDEPVSGMDEEGVDTVGALLKELQSRGVGIVLVSHNMRFLLKIADVVSVLHHGRVIASGTPDEISTTDRVREIYLGSG